MCEEGVPGVYRESMWECTRERGRCGKIWGECAGMCMRETRQSLWRMHRWQGRQGDSQGEAQERHDKGQ